MLILQRLKAIFAGTVNSQIRARGLLPNRHRGAGHPASPATPPDMRVRIRRFGGFSEELTTRGGSPS
ncbi:MAG: hypothetical protein ABSD86_19815, partial [Candidatus Sulfotelmatobacter sp.]